MGREALRSIKVDDGPEVEILGIGESTAYSGRQLALVDFHDVELQNRINRGWAKFNSLKSELTCQHYPLKDRLRLFEACVTPSVLYSCGTWTMNAERERLVRTAQQRMLRKIVRVGRRVAAKDEDKCTMNSQHP